MSKDALIAQLLAKLDEEFAAGTEPLDIDEVAMDVAGADDDTKDAFLSDLASDLKTMGLLSVEWGGFMGSCISLELLLTANDHGYAMSFRDADAGRPTTGWARVTDCNKPGSVSLAAKAWLLDDTYGSGVSPPALSTAATDWLIGRLSPKFSCTTLTHADGLAPPGRTSFRKSTFRWASGRGRRRRTKATMIRRRGR